MPYSPPKMNGRQTGLDALQATALFKAMPDKEGYKLFAASQRVTLDKGEVLHLQGDDAEWFYLVLSGWVKIFRETLNGDEAVIDLVGTGNFIGDTEQLDDGTYKSNAAIAEKAVLLRMPASQLSAAIKNHHTVALAMLEMLSAKRLEHMKEVESLKLQKADQRIGCFMLRQCQGKAEGDHGLMLPYCKTLIASQLGMKGETFSRALNKLRQATDITVSGNRVIVPEISRLSEFVCSGCSNEYPCKDLVETSQNRTLS
ncbi:MAG: Crp/Fnr family transcriptional regulator [Kordiimonadaceae bacterium]|nr:Crp/Fnr family transcriptional regulator [Kordiimonadaceae bacterium]